MLVKHNHLRVGVQKGSSGTLNKQQVPLVTVQAAERDPGLWARVFLEVGAATDPAVCQGYRWRKGSCWSWSRDPCGEGNGHALDGVTVPDHRTLTLFGLPLFHAFDLGLAGFSQPLDCLVLVLFCLLRGLQASLSGSFLAFLHHLCGHLFLLVTHGELQERLALLLMQQGFLITNRKDSGVNILWINRQLKCTLLLHPSLFLTCLAVSRDSSTSFFSSPLSSSSPFSRASSHLSSSSTGPPSMESESMSGTGDVARLLSSSDTQQDQHDEFIV